MNGADDLDRAAELTQNLADYAISEVQRAARPEQVQNPDGTWPHTECVDCGDDLIKERMALGRYRCVFCQEKVERRRAGL